MRLNRYLAACGLGSRRRCEELILGGAVEINGRVCVQLATQVQDGDVVKVNGRRAEAQETITIVLHKPAGLICSKDDERNRRTVYELLPSRYHNLNHVGRLDRSSEGLLLMTNDGELAHQLTHPSHVMEKEYVVTADRAVDAKHLPVWLRGLTTEEGFARAESVRIISPRRVRMVLTTGLKRQIRHMFQELDYKVTRLVRTRIGFLKLDDMPYGAWRRLTAKEIDALRAGSGRPLK